MRPRPGGPAAPTVPPWGTTSAFTRPRAGALTASKADAFDRVVDGSPPRRYASALRRDPRDLGELPGVGVLLEPDDLAVAEVPDVGDLRIQRLPGAYQRLGYPENAAMAQRKAREASR